jgi:hypothetical protein
VKQAICDETADGFSLHLAARSDKTLLGQGLASARGWESRKPI